MEELYDLASYSDGEESPQEEGGQVDSKCQHMPQTLDCRTAKGLQVVLVMLLP